MSHGNSSLKTLVGLVTIGPVVVLLPLMAIQTGIESGSFAVTIAGTALTGIGAAIVGTMLFLNLTMTDEEGERAEATASSAPAARAESSARRAA